MANNANIDLGFICYDMDASELHVLCVLGARYQNLPASMSSRDGGWTYDVNYSYVVDKANSVTKKRKKQYNQRRSYGKAAASFHST